MAVEVQEINPEHPHHRLLVHAARILRAGGVVVYPTDTIYGLGADLLHKGALERILRIKKMSRQKLLSFICPDLKGIYRWAYVPDTAYRIMRRITPGKYTFVLHASPEVPRLLLQKRKTVGIRIPESAVAVGLALELGNPLLSTSVPLDDDRYYTDPQDIADRFRNEVDLILDAGILANQPSTVVDFTGASPLILREGAGDCSLL
jgi:tRNA threonylcarbamoyl adenosine modification protein (Sua5/YciO/YrdC/YwlC family)